MVRQNLHVREFYAHLTSRNETKKQRTKNTQKKIEITGKLNSKVFIVTKKNKKELQEKNSEYVEINLKKKSEGENLSEKN